MSRVCRSQRGCGRLRFPLSLVVATCLGLGVDLSPVRSGAVMEHQQLQPQPQPQHQSCNNQQNHNDRNGDADNLPPSLKGYDEFEMKALDGFQGVSMELNFLDGELNYEVTRDNYVLLDDDVIKVTSHEVSDDEDEDPIIVVPLQRVNSTNFFRFQRNPCSGEYLVGFKPNSFIIMMHPRHGRDLRAFVCLGSEFLDCDGETILRYLRRFDGLEELSIDFKKKTAKLKI